MLSAVHTTDVIYMLLYLSSVAGTSGAVCAHSTNLTLSSPQGMCHRHGSSHWALLSACMHAHNYNLKLVRVLSPFLVWLD